MPTKRDWTEIVIGSVEVLYCLNCGEEQETYYQPFTNRRECVICQDSNLAYSSPPELTEEYWQAIMESEERDE